MSKWRPNITECLYVIADIHGESTLLNKILNRILPLRKSEGIHDKIIFLGDYIDRHKNGYKVIDTLIALKEKYKENIIFLMGNHELLILEALGIFPALYKPFDCWIQNGGYYTVVGYLERANLKINPNSLILDRIKDIIPKNHLEFISNCLPYYKKDNFIFVHGGFNPTRDIHEQKLHDLVWTRYLRDFVLTSIKEKFELPWNEIIVTGHNHNRQGLPIIKDKYLMLDCGAPQRLLVVELNSMEAFMAYPDKNRLIKYELFETIEAPGMFKRIN